MVEWRENLPPDAAHSSQQLFFQPHNPIPASLLRKGAGAGGGGGGGGHGGG